MISHDDVVRWIQRNGPGSIIEAIYDAGLQEEVAADIENIKYVMPIGSNYCGMIAGLFDGELEEEFLVVVRSVEPTDRLRAMKLLRKMGHTLEDSKRLLKETPFEFYCTKDYPTTRLYYDPTHRDESNGGEYFQEAVALGFNMLVISTKFQDIDKWMNTLTEDERKDVVFGLDFYIKLFDESIVIPD